MKVDLHTHSTASDGQYSPAELVGLAKARGIEVLALTDHDTTDGTDEAIEAGAAQGVRVLRGVELSAKGYRHLHILGLNFDRIAPDLQALCAWMKEGRDQRKYRIVDFLKEKGVRISLEEVEELAGGNIIGRPHFAQAMVRRGYVSDTKEAFARYLDTPEYSRIERPKPEAKACVEAIKAAGGKSSLAHPYQLKLEDEALEALIRQMKDWGLDALECYYSKHTPEQTAFYLRLAEKYGLHATAGSDFHGERVKPDVQLTPWALDVGWLC